MKTRLLALLLPLLAWAGATGQELSLGGDGTEANPYQIASIDDWNTFAAYNNPMTGQYVALTADLDFTGTSFKVRGSNGNGFGGVLLGNGHTLSGVAMTGGNSVFNTLLTGGEIRDLTIAGTLNIGSWFRYETGVFVKECRGLISNCTNEVNVTGCGYNVGGIASWVQNTQGGEAAIIGCVNKGAISCTASYYDDEEWTEYGSENIAGIVGMIGDNGRVDGCVNLGDVTSSYMVGGIVAATRSNAGYPTNCVNAGNAKAVGGNAGGIMPAGNPKGCLNTGAVVAVAGNAGGIVAEAGGEFKNNVNLGAVTAREAAGGIVGVPSNNTLRVDNCYNAGSVAVSGASGSCGNIIGVGERHIKYPDETGACYYLDGLNPAAQDNLGEGMTLAGMCALDMGEDFMGFDAWSLPMPAALAEQPAALVAAAQVILAEGDTNDAVTGDFHVGVPEGVTWSCDPAVLAFAGNDARVSAEHHGTVTLTATAGGCSKSVELTLDATPGTDPKPGIRGDVNGDGMVDVADINEIINIMLGKE